MSDLPITLPRADSAENIPAALAAPKPRKGKAKPVVAAPVAPVAAPAPIDVPAPVEASPQVDVPALVDVPAPVAASALVDPVIEASVTAAAEPAMDVAEPSTPIEAPPEAAELSSFPTAAAPAEPAQQEPTMTDTIDHVTHDAAAKTEAMLGDFSARAKGAMEKSTAMFADWNNFSRGNVEALVESGKLAMSGLSSLAQDRAAYVRKQVEDTTAAVRTMASAKSPTEFVKLQGEFVREQFDAMVAETSRSTEAALKLAGEVAQPISNRMALAAEKVRAIA